MMGGLNRLAAGSNQAELTLSSQQATFQNKALSMA